MDSSAPNKTILRRFSFWQPWLLLLILVFIALQIWFLTALTYSVASAGMQLDIDAMELAGRSIASAGFSLSVIIGISRFRRLYSRPRWQRGLIKIAVGVVSTVVVYFGLKLAYQGIQERVRFDLIHCSVAGGLASQSLHGWQVDASGSMSVDKALLQLLLPLAVCLDDGLYEKVLASESTERDLKNLFASQGKLELIQRRMVNLYRQLLHRLPQLLPWYSQYLAAEKGNQRQLVLADFEQQLQIRAMLDSQLNRSQIERIVQLFESGAALHQTSPGLNQAYSLMLAATQLLYDGLSKRQPYLVQPVAANQIYTVANDMADAMARLFLAQQQPAQNQLLEAMRPSFGLVLLPVFAVALSTFVISLAIANYVRSRLFRYAHHKGGQVNPIFNAVLSVLVIIPLVWWLLFNLLNETPLERQLFPQHVQSPGVIALKVALRPLLYLYEPSKSATSSFVGYDALRVFAKPIELAEQQPTSAVSLAGLWFGDVCLSSNNCEPIGLVVSPGASYAYFPNQGFCQVPIVPLPGLSAQSDTVVFAGQAGAGDCSLVARVSIPAIKPADMATGQTLAIGFIRSGKSTSALMAYYPL